MYIGQEFQGGKYGDAVRYVGTVELKSFEELQEDVWKILVLDTLEIYAKHEKLNRGWYLMEEQCELLGKKVDVYQHILHNDYEGTTEELDDFCFVLHGEPWSEDLPYNKSFAVVDCCEDDYDIFNYLIKNKLTLSI